MNRRFKLMRRFAFALTIAVGAFSASAWAAPTRDIGNWAQRFTQAALKTNTDDILGLIREIAEPRFQVDVVNGTLDSVKHSVGTQAPQYAEQFGEIDQGTFYKRLNFAVKYEHSILFYSVALVRSADGWELIGFAVDGNLNHILNLQWPS